MELMTKSAGEIMSLAHAVRRIQTDPEISRRQHEYTYEQCRVILYQHLRQLNGGRHLTVDRRDQEIYRQCTLWAMNSGEFAGDPEKGLILTGEYGCGKTTLAMAVKRLCDILYPDEMRFTTLSRIKDKIIQHNDLSLVREFISGDWVYDDAGKEEEYVEVYRNGMNVFAKIIDERYNRRRFRAVITSNLHEHHWSELYGDLTLSRMRQMFNPPLRFQTTVDHRLNQ